MTPFAADFRELVQTARWYVRGQAHFMDFYYDCAKAAHEAAWFPPSKPLGDLVTEWYKQAERCRNEWELETEPLSEADFKNWLAAQLM